jgi:hypothetical protein
MNFAFPVTNCSSPAPSPVPVQTVTSMPHVEVFECEIFKFDANAAAMGRQSMQGGLVKDLGKNHVKRKGCRYAHPTTWFDCFHMPITS